MDITERMILDRLDLLGRDLEQARRQVLALDGAVQDSRHWLAVVREEKKPDRIPDVNEIFPEAVVRENGKAE